jgi:hypothetical protein
MGMGEAEAGQGRASSVFISKFEPTASGEPTVGGRSIGRATLRGSALLHTYAPARGDVSGHVFWLDPEYGIFI